MSYSVGSFELPILLNLVMFRKFRMGKIKQNIIIEDDINLSPTSTIRLVLVMVVKVAGCYNLVC